MNTPTDIRSTKRGSALATTVLIITVLSVIMASMLKYATSEKRINHRHELRVQANNTAEAVVEFGFAQLSYTFTNKTSVGANTFKSGTAGALKLPPAAALRNNIDHAAFEIFTTSVPATSLTYINPDEPDNLFDPLKGKFVRSLEVGIFGKAVVTDPSGGPDISSYISQTFEVRDSPLFSHAIFYNLDLDLHPGPDMDVYGPVHTNQDLRVAPYRNLNFKGVVTSAKNIFHQYEHLGTSRTGPVNFQNNSGTMLNMNVGGGWKDSEMGTGSISPDFRSFASNRWEGNVQTSAHGIRPYKPVAFADYEPDDLSTAAYDPVNPGRDIIEPPLAFAHPDYNAEIEKQKMSNKAGLYFKWDTATSTIKAWDGDNNLLDVSDLEGTLWNTSTMAEYRRGVWIDTIDVHTGHLKQLIENPDTSDDTLHIGGYNPSTEWNGIVYFECYSSDPDATLAANLNYTGVRLLGGETDVVGEGIPSRGSDPGMSFVTNNFMYVQGHFNSDGVSSSSSAYVPEFGEVPVALMGDTVTFLSESWSDAVTTGKPSAVTTEVSAAVVSGTRPPNVQGDNSYSGGAHNFPRFLENWSGDTFYLRGSMVALFETELDSSKWSTSYYSPPNRGYGFNELFKDGTYPPGTPLLRTYRRSTYQSLTASEYATATTGL